MLCRYVLTYVGMYSLKQGSEDVWCGMRDMPLPTGALQIFHLSQLLTSSVWLDQSR